MSKLYGPLALPKSGKEIYFTEPTGGDRLEVLKNNPMGTDDYISKSALTDLYLAAKTIKKIDGRDASGDYKHYFDGLPNSDVEYYTSIHRKMFTLSNESLDKMDQVVDFLLNVSGPVASSSLTTSQTAQSVGATGTE